MMRNRIHKGSTATRADALPGVGKVLGPGEIPAKHPFPRNSGQEPK